MKKKIEIVPTGLSLIDCTWGGFYRASSYLLIGAHKTGRTLIALQFAQECVRQKEVCVFFTNMRPKDLMIQASSIDFDLQRYVNENQVIIVRVTPPVESYENEISDEYLSAYLKDIIAVVNEYQPSKMVFDEITPFIGFQDSSYLENQFKQTIEGVEELGVTSLFVIGDPATATAKELVETIVSSCTGIIYVEKTDDNSRNGKMIITPNIGHTEGKFSASFSIEPYKGIVIDLQELNLTNHFNYLSPKDSKYTPISEIQSEEDDYHFSNIYDLGDFNLILNNQIALFNSTGQTFNVISFKLDLHAERISLLTLKQLQNAIRLSTDKKDKICNIEDKILVLISRDESNILNRLVGKLKSNLPSTDVSYIENVCKFISVYQLKINSNIKNSDDVFATIADNQHEIATS